MKSTIAFLIAFCLFAASIEAADTRPNIVYFLIDDQGYADVVFNGCQNIRTRNIDKLAKQGAMLDCFYGQPVCSPTRAALMTGRYPTRTGIYNVTQRDGPLPLNERTLAEALREVGYTTAICGKWHLGLDTPSVRERMTDRRDLKVNVVEDKAGVLDDGTRYFLKWESRGKTRGRHAPEAIPDGPLSSLVVVKTTPGDKGIE